MCCDVVQVGGVVLSVFDVVQVGGVVLSVVGWCGAECVVMLCRWGVWC